MTDALSELHNQRKALQTKIEASLEDPQSKGQLQELRSKLGKLKNVKGSLIKEKQALRAELNAIKASNDKILQEKKDAKASVKYGSVDEINKQIQILQTRQETTSMSLAEEKKLIKEIDALQQSKSLVSSLKDKDAAMDDIKVRRKALGEQINAKDKEIDAQSKEMDAIVQELNTLNAAQDSKRGAIKGLFTERDAVKKQIGEKLKEKDALRDAFREQNDQWYDYQRAVKAQKKMQYEAEKAEREKERAEYEAALEAEEAKKIPYEEEQALCDFLANFLERTYVTNGTESTSKPVDDVVKPTDDPFAGFKAVGKKADDNEEGIYFGKGKGKKKRVRATKKQDSTAGPFTLSVDMFEQFAMIQLDPPTNLEAVPGAISALKEKKAWYKEQPRGSVPTAKDIRKQLEQASKKHAQNSQNSSNQPQSGGNKKGSKKAPSQDDFLPLSAGTSASMTASSSWGKPSAP